MKSRTDCVSPVTRLIELGAEEIDGEPDASEACEAESEESSLEQDEPEASRPIARCEAQQLAQQVALPAGIFDGGGEVGGLRG
ncbi:MAG TPA: hypothetical protein VMN36_10540 [Verrucomicrobiales bacterium]|nr:hypothetical protein [Verrucomicrobiales bacterium]